MIIIESYNPVAMTMLMIIITLLQVADSYLTVHILKDGGRELNPFMDWLFGRIGLIPGLAITKTLFVAGLVAIMPYAPLAVYIVIALAYAGIVVHNMVEYRKR